MQVKGKSHASQTTKVYPPNKKVKKLLLPYGWRKQVVTMLQQQEIKVHPQTITDLLNGRRTNPALMAAILRCRKKISRQYKAQISKVKTLRSAA